MPNRDINIILTCIGSPMAWEMIKSFSSATSLNVKVIGVDMNRRAIGRNFLRSFYTVPSGKDPRYVEIIMDICKKEAVDVIVPGSDEESFTLAENLELFQDVLYVFLIFMYQIDRIQKDRLARFM